MNLLYSLFSRTSVLSIYFFDFCLCSFITIISIFYFQPKYNYYMLGHHIWSNSKRGIIGACALSAWTYNAEVQGSDARIRNHFVYIYIYIYKCFVTSIYLIITGIYSFEFYLVHHLPYTYAMPSCLIETLFCCNYSWHHLLIICPRDHLKHFNHIASWASSIYQSW